MDLKKKTITFSVISGAIVVVFVGFVICPLWKGIKGNSEELIIAKKELVSMQGKTGKFEQFKKTYQELEPDLKKTDKLFADPEVPIDLIEFLEDTVGNLGLMIEISPIIKKAPEGDPWNSIFFQITLTGSFSNFLKFLEKIETAPYLIEVQNLTIAKLTEENLKRKGYEQFSPGDVRATVLTKIFTK